MQAADSPNPANELGELQSEARRLLESAIEQNLELTYEQRIEAHENARQLMNDLREAGQELRGAES